MSRNYEIGFLVSAVSPFLNPICNVVRITSFSSECAGVSYANHTSFSLYYIRFFHGSSVVSAPPPPPFVPTFTFKLAGYLSGVYRRHLAYILPHLHGHLLGYYSLWLTRNIW